MKHNGGMTDGTERESDYVEPTSAESVEAVPVDLDATDELDAIVVTDATPDVEAAGGEPVTDEPARDGSAVEDTAVIEPVRGAPVVESVVATAPVVEAAPVVETVPVAESATAGPREIATHAARRRRRRWPWVTLGAILAVLVVALAGGLWYISGLVGAGAKVDRESEAFPMTIEAAGDGATVSYAGSTGGWVDQGLMGIATIDGGYAQTEAVDAAGSGDTASGTRAVTSLVLPPAPASGEAATLDGWFFPRNPKIGLGLDYQDVVYDGPLGPTPAWFIPGTRDTWVVFTHGRGATPLEGLRIAQTANRLGFPVLLIRYRNDAKSPEGNGYGQFGADEWQDLESAVQFAVDKGAQDVVLAGASMGGAITLAFLQNSALADRAVGAFLDSPVADFGQVVDIGAEDLGVPAPIAGMAKQVAAWRFGFDWDAIDYTARAADFATPMLIVQGTGDETVQPVVSADFVAAADPALVDLEVFDGAAHVMSWNTERSRYESLLSGFLDRVAPAAAP